MTRVVLAVWGFQTFGGMERHVVELALGLHRAGARVTVVSETPVRASNDYARSLRAGGVDLHAPPLVLRAANAARIALCRSKAAAARLIHGGGLLSRRLVRVLDRLFAGDGLRVLHVHGCRLGQSWLLDWARGRGVASVYTEHMDIVAGGGPLTPDGVRFARSAGALACVSEQSRRSLASLFDPPPPIAVTGHIVHAPGDAPGREATLDRFQLLCPARLETHKGVDVLLRAFAQGLARRPTARLVLAGGGGQRAKLKALARDLNIDGATHFAGALPPARLAAELARADAVVLPSRTEGLPLALLEAMAQGKAVVVSDAGGMPEMIEDGETGLIVARDDAEALAGALDALASDPALRARLGSGARRAFLSSRHHQTTVIPEIQALYRRAAVRC